MSTREIKGFSDMRALREKLSRLPGVGSKIAARIAASFSSSARASNASGSSVYGKPFESKDGKRLTLRKSGRLLDVAASFVAIGRVVRSSIAAISYGRYRVKDGILPRSSMLPDAWQKDAERIAREEIDAALAGGIQ